MLQGRSGLMNSRWHAAVKTIILCDMPFVHLAGQFSFYNAEIKSSHGIIANLNDLKGISFHSLLCVRY